ncbi:site-specific integrase [Bdellovibrionota bacterium FG-1]
MAIMEYQSDAGEKLWKAYVCVRSRVNPGIRLQRWKFGCKTLKQAEREEVKLLRDCQAEVLKKETQGSSWGAVVEAWSKHLSLETTEQVLDETRKDYVASLVKHTSHWWKRSANEITRGDIQELFGQLKANGSSNSFLAKTKNTIHRVFAYGMERGLIKGIDRAPTYGITIQRKEERKPEILTLEQIRKLLTEARNLKSRWYPIWTLALLTGMRSGELYALLWGDVDWENKQLSVTKSFNCRRKLIKSTKSGDWRTVPISGDLMTVLKELKAQAGDRPSILPRIGCWSRGMQATRLREFCIGIGLPSIRFHTLRACFATQLIRSGVAPIRIQKVCGWKDLATMARYIRLAGIEIEGATDTLRVLPEAEVMERAGSSFTQAPDGTGNDDKQDDDKEE